MTFVCGSSVSTISCAPCDSTTLREVSHIPKSRPLSNKSGRDVDVQWRGQATFPKFPAKGSHRGVVGAVRFVCDNQFDLARVSELLQVHAKYAVCSDAASDEKSSSARPFQCLVTLTY